MVRVLRRPIALVELVVLCMTDEPDEVRRLRSAISDAVWQLRHDYAAGALAVLLSVAEPSGVGVPQMARYWSGPVGVGDRA